MRRFSSPVPTIYFMSMGHRRRLWPVLLISLVAALSSVAAGKVKVELYYETLCPYCSNFIVNYLPELFHSGLISAVDLTLYPYGNAKLSSDGSITCQHGENECLLNTMEACAIDAWPNVEEHFQFIYCVESLVFNNNFSQWETCFDTLGFHRTPIYECYNSGRGKKLEIRYAKETDALKPPHQYVPWVVVDGKPLYDDYENFMSYICQAYKGPPLKVCNGLPLIRKRQVSYTEKFSRRGKIFSNKEGANVAVLIEYDTSAKA